MIYILISILSTERSNFSGSEFNLEIPPTLRFFMNKLDLSISFISPQKTEAKNKIYFFYNFTHNLIYGFVIIFFTKIDNLDNINTDILDLLRLKTLCKAKNFYISTYS